MIKFDFIEDKEFTGILDNLISCLLPHDNYNGDYFAEILDSITKLVRIDEMSCSYEVLMTVLTKMRTITVVHQEYRPRLDRAQFDIFLGSSIPDYIDNDSRKVTSWLADLGVMVNLEIPKDLDTAKSTLYQASMELYDTCFQLQIDSSSYPALLVSLKDAFKTNAIMEGQMVQRKILSNGIWIGRRNFKGSDDWLDYTTSYSNEIRTRLNDTLNDNLTILDSLDKAEQLLQKNKDQSISLGNYGIPELDDYTPMLRHRLVVLVAQTNTGKTIEACNLASTLLIEGRRVVFMCGESLDNQITNRILPSYIKKTRGLYVSETQILGREEMSEEQHRLVRVALKEITESGNLIFNKTFTYDNVGQELRELYAAKPFDAVFIDHSAALSKAPGSKLFGEKDCIDQEAIQLREFKLAYPVYIFVTSHPSSDASKELTKLKRVESDSPTRSSGVLSKEADELFVLYKTPELDKQDKVGMQICKRRLARCPRNHIFLKADYAAQMFNYSDKDQAMDDSIVQREKIIGDIERGEEVSEEEFNFNIFDEE